jgi:hypothetical protein
MASPSLDVEFSKYWTLLTPVQKQSILSVIKSFVQPEERITNDTYNHEISEAESEYNSGDFISQEEMLKLIQKW